MEQNTYQILEEIAEGEERRRGQQKRQERVKKKRKCRLKIKQMDGKDVKMNYKNGSQCSGIHT